VNPAKIQVSAFDTITVRFWPPSHPPGITRRVNAQFRRLSPAGADRTPLSPAG